MMENTEIGHFAPTQSDWSQIWHTMESPHTDNIHTVS